METQKKKHAIKVIAFDADDTLWSNEPFFQEVERKYTDLLSEYDNAEEISAELFQTEMDNLECLGYGAKAFTISMVETALRVSERKISADKIQQIILLGKSLLQMPIELLPGVEETLKALKEQGRYRLVVATKGDLLDQERKLHRSGLTSYFDHIEIMSDKTEKEYTRLLQTLQVAPEEFLMIGNSLKSDIQPVLAIGGYGVHIPFEVMWQHEVVGTFAHPRLKQMKSPAELLEWLSEITPLITQSNEAGKKSLLIWHECEYLKLESDEILWIEASRSNSVLHLTNNREMVVPSVLGIVEKDLSNLGFIRTHRSYIVNLKYTNSLIGNSIEIGGKLLPIGTQYRETVCDHFIFLGTRKKF